MYEIIKSVITSGTYELSDMISKIKTIWLEGGITDDQKTELVALAQEKADPRNSYATLEQQVETLFQNMAEMAGTIKTIQAEITALKGEETDPEETEVEYPEYVQPTGAHDAYSTGDKITYNGKQYICLMDNCVWDPDTYPNGWKTAE